MGYFSKFLGLTAAIMLLSATVVGAEEKDPLKPRVPPDQIGGCQGLEEPGREFSREHCEGEGLV